MVDSITTVNHCHLKESYMLTKTLHRSGCHLLTMVVVGQFDSPAFHQQAEEYATALEG